MSKSCSNTKVREAIRNALDDDERCFVISGLDNYVGMVTNYNEKKDPNSVYGVFWDLEGQIVHKNCVELADIVYAGDGEYTVNELLHKMRKIKQAYDLEKGKIYEKYAKEKEILYKEMLDYM